VSSPSRISFYLQPSKKLAENSSARMRSLHDPACTQSLYDSPIVCVLFTRYFMSQCWNQHHRTKYRTESNPCHPPILVDDEPEFEISKILDSKLDHRCRAFKLLYLVRWTGYKGTDEETSWILATELGHASELVTDFHKAYQAKPGPLSSLS